VTARYRTNSAIWKKAFNARAYPIKTGDVDICKLSMMVARKRRTSMPVAVVDFLACESGSKRPPTAAALLVDLPELLFQFSDQPVYTFLGFIVRDASRYLAIFHNLHFEFYTLVF
jgi:hypothetical protein